MSALQVRELGPDDRDQAVALAHLAFGGDPAAPLRPPSPGARAWGGFLDDRLLVKATWRTYAQWWGGRRVPMGGVGGVAVHPDARGGGAASRLVRLLVEQMRAAGQPISVLFPTAPGIYRPLGWEVVATLDDTRLPTAALQRAGDPGPVTLRSAGHDDVPALTGLWQRQGAATQGQLSRDGVSWPRGLETVLAHDVVQVAEQDGRATGYLAYDRGRGYGPTAELTVAELVADTAEAQAALLRSLGSWDSVAGGVRWRGPVDDVQAQVRALLPPPAVRRPWMLRVLDAPGAVAARGFRAGATGEAVVTLVDPEGGAHEGAWRLRVHDGQGRLERTPEAGPRLHVRGLALLYAGAADPDRLVRLGLLEHAVPGLDVFGGPPPVLLDDF